MIKLVKKNSKKIDFCSIFPTNFENFSSKLVIGLRGQSENQGLRAQYIKLLQMEQDNY